MSSETSTPYTPAFTSITVAGNETVSLANEVKKYDTAKLIEYLQGQEDLGLNDDNLKIIHKEKVNGHTFFKITKEELERHEMKLGSATALVDFAKDCKDKKLKAFSLYLSLSEVLAEYDLGDDIDSIPLFFSPTYKIQDSNKVYKRCIEEILDRLCSY